MTLVIRPETPLDAPAIQAVVAAAFDDDGVAHLVHLLRTSAGYRPDLALVAQDSSGVVGHVMLTRIPVYRPNGDVRQILCLSPLSVRPDRQRAGIGRALTEQVLRRADQQGEPLVVLEGDPALYRRFGFVAAEDHGLLRPSPTIPEPAFQIHRLAAYDPRIRGQVRYPSPFWAVGGAGLPEQVEATGVYAVAWLFQFARYAGWIEAATASADLSRPVPDRPGWTAGDVLRQLGATYRVVAGWIQQGRRPIAVTDRPEDGDVRTWFGQGWRDLYGVLAASPPDTPAAGWSPWDTTIGFWRRRTVHDTAIHAHDVLAAVDGGGPAWTVTEGVALDGIDEALRLWLGTRLGQRAAGSGRVVRVVAGTDAAADGWTVGLHHQLTEIHRLPTPADAVVLGSAAAVYRWLWGRSAEDTVDLSGDRAAVTELRTALDTSMGLAGAGQP